jgi:hypothetical protein
MTVSCWLAAAGVIQGKTLQQIREILIKSDHAVQASLHAFICFNNSARSG